MLHKTYKFIAYPKKHQQTQLNYTLELCREIYNKTLFIRKEFWEKENKSIGLYDCHKLLTIWKKEKPELFNVHSQVLYDVQVRIDLAFQTFFRRLKCGEKAGYPRFKSKDRYDSFTYTQVKAGFHFTDQTITIPKIGKLRIRGSKEIIGKVKTVSIQKLCDKWFVCVNTEYEEVDKKPISKFVGIDLGCKTFAYLSDDTKIDHPNFLKRSCKEIARLQRKNAKLGYKHKKPLNKCYQKLSNRRKDFCHKISRKIINSYDFIAIEDLKINKMLDGSSKRPLNQKINDSCWRTFTNMLFYKAEDAGKTVVKVDPAGTSQNCSRCGSIVSKNLSNRMHDCPYCGLSIDRDLNAAINILRLGLQSQEFFKLQKAA